MNSVFFGRGESFTSFVDWRDLKYIFKEKEGEGVSKRGSKVPSIEEVGGLL